MPEAVFACGSANPTDALISSTRMIRAGCATLLFIVLRGGWYNGLQEAVRIDLQLSKHLRILLGLLGSSGLRSQTRVGLQHYEQLCCSPVTAFMAGRVCQEPQLPKITMFESTSEMRLYGRDGARLYVNEAERARFLKTAQSAPAPIRSLCLTLAYTGCRISEALSLTPISVQSATAVISIRTLKKRNKFIIREVPVPESLIELLIVDHSLIEGGADQGTGFWPIDRSTAWRQVKAVMQAAGITGPQATAKGLRHGFGVHALISGVPLNLLQRWMGHAHISVTAVYGKAVGPEERDIARRMWN